ncbi:MAG: nuclear transport factor 2 family protein, partial [Congregibacter sp.]|nr:nuclear transport factor 2 family protein [Congregibacter sp.]
MPRQIFKSLTLISAIFWAFSTVSITLSASAFADDHDDLAALIDQFLAGASVNDVAMHQRFWSDDLVYTGSGGSRYGKQTILNGMKEPSPAGEASAVYSSDQMKIRILADDVAVVTFRLVSTDRDGAI